MAALSRFSEDVLEEELNALIQKAISEKTKIARKQGLKNLKGKKEGFEVPKKQSFQDKGILIIETEFVPRCKQ